MTYYLVTYKNLMIEGSLPTIVQIAASTERPNLGLSLTEIEDRGNKILSVKLAEQSVESFKNPSPSDKKAA